MQVRGNRWNSLNGCISSLSAGKPPCRALASDVRMENTRVDRRVEVRTERRSPYVNRHLQRSLPSPYLERRTVMGLRLPVSSKGTEGIVARCYRNPPSRTGSGSPSEKVRERALAAVLSHWGRAVRAEDATPQTRSSNNRSSRPSRLVRRTGALPSRTGRSWVSEECCGAPEILDVPHGCSCPGSSDGQMIAEASSPAVVLRTGMAPWICGKEVIEPERNW